MLISIVVPVYKVENYLHRCVDSILAQTFADYELILVDDGSPDNCGQICDEYAEKDSRIKVIHKQNGGLSDARNAGIDWCFENSDFEWITFIDSDDWVHPEYLERLYQAVIDTGCSVSVCSYKNTSQTRIDPLDRFQVKVYNTERFYCEKNVNSVVAWGKLYAKECFNDIRYPVGKLHEDEFTTYKIIFRYNDIAFLESKLYYYYVNNDSITKSKWNPKRLDALYAVEQQSAFFRKNRYKEAYQCCLYLYLSVLIFNISETEGKTDYKHISKSLLRKLRYSIFKYRNNKYYKFKDNKYIYEIAFPNFMRIYWFFVSKKNYFRKR